MTATRFGIPLSKKDASWAVEQACLAPSVHNTQPWRFSWNGNSFELHADTTRGLTASDPDGRELVISCGAALLNLRLALRKLGHEGRIDPLPDAANPRVLARIHVSETTPADTAERRTYAAMIRRHTHRGLFDDRPLPPAILVAMQHAAELEFAHLVFVADPGQRRRVHSLARAAERSQANDPAVRMELTQWTPAPDSRRRDGVPASAYAAEPVAHPDDLAPRNYDQGRSFGLAEPVENRPGVVGVLVTDGDLERHWLAGGQALERILVCAAENGVYASMHSQLAEVPNLRNELRRELCISGYPQLLLRFGFATDVEHTPRRPVDEVLVLP
jgi:hypothetical protein